MIARLLISASKEVRVEEIGEILSGAGLKKDHPDVLYFTADSKLGIEQARKIREHFSLKPYQAKGRAVVLEDASNLTQEAQNALLKTLEEPPPQALLVLSAPSDTKFLPTLLSRCEVIHIPDVSTQHTPGVGKFDEDVAILLKADISERFEYIEKLKDREEFFHLLVRYFHQNLASHIGSGNTDYGKFLKELLQAEEWQKQNVNIRAILEYLMLSMPQKL